MGMFGRKKKKSSDAASTTGTVATSLSSSIPRQAVELGTINYVNLTEDGRHGDYEKALQVARETGKPIFANFVEWSGWAGCKDAGSIFASPEVKRAAEELFVPCAFNTWDRSDPKRNEAMRKWGAGLANSWWGYLRIINPEGNQIITGTRQITSRGALNQVKAVMREGLEDLAIDVPDYLK